MKRPVKVILTVGFVVILLYMALNVVNVLQNGIGGSDGRTAERILGIPLEKAAKGNLAALSKFEVMQLFYALDPPAIGELAGEYRAANLDVGVMAFSVQIFTDHFFGPGAWQGKGFVPGKADKGEGYNLFSDGVPGAAAIRRTRRTATHVGPSNIDDKPSFHLVYDRFNSGLVRSMHDELRRVNGRLYLGMGYMALGGGSINPSPFVVYGAPTPCSGPDPEP